MRRFKTELIPSRLSSVTQAIVPTPFEAGSFSLPVSVTVSVTVPCNEFKILIKENANMDSMRSPSTLNSPWQQHSLIHYVLYGSN